MLVYFKNKIITLDWLDIKMSNQFFIEFLNSIEKLDFFKIEISKITKLESQRDYFSDGSYRTNTEIEIVTSDPIFDYQQDSDNLGTTFLFVNGSAYLFEEAYIINKHISISSSQVYNISISLSIRASNYVVLNINQLNVLDTFFKTKKIDTSILTFDTTINFFEK